MKYSKLVNKVLELNKYIKFSTNDKDLQVILQKYSKKTEIPKDILINEAHQILSRKINYKENKIDIFDNRIFFLKNSINFLILTLILILKFLIPFKKKIEKKKYSILVDGILSKGESERFYHLSTFFEKICLISKSNYQKNYMGKHIDYFSYNIFKIFLFNKKKHNFFLIFFQLLFISLKNKKDYFLIFNEITYKYLKYNFIFDRIISSYLIQEKFYDTSCIKNYIFKTKGGLITSCVQKNILELSLSNFIFIDVFFSLSEKSAEVISILSGKVKKVIPVGSLFMEQAWHLKSKDLKIIPDYDLLYVGINYIDRKKKFEILDTTSNLYETFDWIKKISIKFPKIRVAIKHHDNYLLDKTEAKLLQGANLKIDKNSLGKNKSYSYTFKSKFICTWGSTMALEMLGEGKPCYFLDPRNLNDQFFIDYPELNKWRISSYEEFESKVLSQLYENNGEFVKDPKNYCFKSNTVSKLIYENLTRLRNI